MAKRIFIILLMIWLILISGWYLFIYAPDELQLWQAENEMCNVLTKIEQAVEAGKKIEQVQAVSNNNKIILSNLRNRIVDRSKISKVTTKMRRLADNHNLKLTNFSPLTHDFISSPGDSADVIPAIVLISVQGAYLNIGRYIESWEKLPFYIIAEEVSIETLNKNLKAQIRAKLFTWNN